MHKIIASGAVAVLLTGAGVAFAQTGVMTASQATTTRPQVNASCIQLAVDTREGSIGSAFSAFSTSMSTALATRRAALNTAWGMTDASARRTARAAAWNSYSASAKTAFAALKTARKTAWSDFKTASKACGVPVVESQSADGTGTIGL